MKYTYKKILKSMTCTLVKGTKYAYMLLGTNEMNNLDNDEMNALDTSDVLDANRMNIIKLVWVLFPYIPHI